MKISFFGLCATIYISAALLLAPALAQASEESRAKVVKISGDAQYKKADTDQWIKLESSHVLSEADAVKTAANSEVVLEFTGTNKTAEVTVRPSSEFVFETFRHDPDTKIENTLLDVSLGAVLVKAEKLTGSSKFEVKTPTSIVGIRGTTFEVSVS